jgi:hypothetical protein
VIKLALSKASITKSTIMRFFTCSLLAILISFSVHSQRSLATVLDPAVEGNRQSAVLANKVIIATSAQRSLLSYNDVSFTSFTYPTVSGIPLKFDSYNNPLVHFNLGLYFSLYGTSGTTSVVYLYRFSGSTFTRVLLPGPVISNCIFYSGNLYFLCNVSGWRTLYRYDGTTATALGSVPYTGSYKLLVTGNFLYIAGYGTMTGMAKFIHRFDGTSTVILPYSGAGTLVQDAYGVPGTSRVYFTAHERIVYYNGSTASEVFFNTGESVYARMWRDNLYFTTGVGPWETRSHRLYRLSGSALTLLSLPPGASIAAVGATNPEVFNDELYVAMTFTDGSKKVMRYNGSVYYSVYDITTSVLGGVKLFVRNSRLMIQPNFANDNYAVEYDGFEFIQINGVPGRLMFPWMNGTSCNHLWLNYYSDAGGIHWAFAKEPLGCPPPPGPPAPPAIPEGFGDFERFEFDPYAVERGWCWSEILIDWVIVPYCPLPPCPLQNFSVRMQDANNGIAWSQKFSTPSTFQVPLADVQGYKTVLSSTDKQQDLLVFDADLVEKGIASLKVDIRPKQNYFTVTASTKNNMQVPLTVTLTDVKGNAIWSKSFTAPFSQQITDRVQQRGQTLVFSVPDQGGKLITKVETRKVVDPCTD